MDKIELLQALSPEEKMALARQWAAEEQAAKNREKEAFEGIRSQFLFDVKKRFSEYVQHGRDFKKWLREETEGFYRTLIDYGKLKRDEQIGFKVSDDAFSLQVKGCRVKKFDERADIAEKRLADFLNAWIEDKDGGARNPMYKLAMAMIQRNETGDLDYKSISRLYELEADFNDPEYSSVMELFRESNVVLGTSINFYFEEKDQYNNWRKIEPSFNRIRG
ncbi:MAG: DUF3164 family protein [Tannerellaceae bacterium]|jgi:hypothetical protein|nr:DUF3164 family protein [Tannerellaceae bacterium]